jgi:hypothetical protein
MNESAVCDPTRGPVSRAEVGPSREYNNRPVSIINLLVITKLSLRLIESPVRGGRERREIASGFDV